MKKHIANMITGCRILGSILLLFFPAFSIPFYLIYVICGLTDMIDGTIARKTNSAGESGARFDTAADLVFATVSLSKMLPKLNIPQWLWIWVAVIAVIKIGNMIWAYVSKKQFLYLHTVMNKFTGAILFLLPLTSPLVGSKYSSIAVCSIASFAAIQEMVYIAADCGCK